MPHTLYLVPSGAGVGLTSLALGLVRALDNRGIRVAFFKPIGQSATPEGFGARAADQEPERSTYFVRQTSSLRPSAPVPLETAARLIAQGRMDELLDQVMRGFHESAPQADVVVVEGLIDAQESSGETELNRELVRTLSAEVIVAGALGDCPLEEFESRLEHTASRYGGTEAGRVLGCIVNRVGPSIAPNVSGSFGRTGLRVLGLVPENPELLACRTLDVARYLKADIVHEGEMRTRRVRKFVVLARTIPNMVGSLSGEAILVTPGDRADVVVLVALAATNKIPLSGLVVTGDLPISPPILELCRPALETGLPVLSVRSDTWETAAALAKMSTEIPVDDLDRARLGMSFIAEHIDADFIAQHSQVPLEARVSPAAFCYRLTDKARSLKRRIVLPEGNEPRTVRAASICAERGIARCVLLGNPSEVRRVASAQEIDLPAGVEVLDPTALRARYVAPLVEMRKHKGLTVHAATELLEDNVWLGTMMLASGEVDGLVSGAVHSTANTIRPALQIVKTRPGAKVVSSVFFMCLPEQVVVYGDCAVIPDPDAETLADIALQSADSAARFGIEPRVAMISYSTGESGSGSDVDKVRQATRIAQTLRPSLLIDGPLQYDAAAIPDVAAAKAPKSRVAGHATVFIFPDLNTGNTTYKAVRRSAHVISVGPMLQGLRRPVNDLSRGALVEDIVYTIAITAIQSDQRDDV